MLLSGSSSIVTCLGRDEALSSTCSVSGYGSSYIVCEAPPLVAVVFANRLSRDHPPLTLDRRGCGGAVAPMVCIHLAT